jgi:conjugative relaxase-like TrwC/TraI family protein
LETESRFLMPAQRKRTTKMLRITMSVSPAAAAKYFDSALEKADYYAKSEATGKGVWGGSGAEGLGLTGEVRRDDFIKLACNDHPLGGSLTERTKEKRRAGYDFTFSVPKSVSLYLAETGDRDVETMIQAAFKETMSDIERRMEARVRGKDEDGLSRDEDRATGNLAYAAFTHTVSRPVAGIPDPHYHLHAFVFNATFDELEARWKAGQFGNIKRDAPFYEAAFNARLAKTLVEGGYGIRRTERSFELASVSRELIEKFSRRTNEIERLAREKYPVLETKARALVKETGMDFADAFAQVKSELGALSREKKSAAILGPSERLRFWRGQMTAEERASLSRDAVQSTVCQGLLELESAKPLAVQHLFERVSVARQLHAAGMLLRRAVGKATVEEAERFSTTDPLFVRTMGGYLTTAEVLAEEAQLLERVESGRAKFEPLGGSEDWPISDPRVLASEEQSLAIEHVLRTRDLLTAVRGAAGTGKTTMMTEAVKALETLSTRNVFVFAPSSSAVEVLRREGFTRAETLQKLMHDEELRLQTRRQILWVDEAGFLSVRQMSELVAFALENDCRLILSGDTRQHHGVERGDALRILERAGVIEQAALTKIFRQQIAALREAVSDLARGRTERGFDRLEAFGAIAEVEGEAERLKAISDQHLSALGAGRTSMIVSPAHAEARLVAEAVRRELRTAGLIGATEETFERLENLNWTEAQKRDAVNYAPGQIVEFHRITKAIPSGQRREPKFLSGEQWRVKRREGNSVIIERNGGEKELPLSQAKNFSTYSIAALALSVGDRVRITKNFVVRDMDGKSRCRNNDVHTMTAISEDGIRLDSGVSLKRGKWHLDQGLVVTSHAAQGKTVDQVLVSVPIKTFSQVNEAQWYVSLSRARAAMYVFTDSIGALKEAVMRPSGRVSAHEMLGQLSSLRDRNLKFSPARESGIAPERSIEKIAIQRNR